MVLGKVLLMFCEAFGLPELGVSIGRRAKKKPSQMRWLYNGEYRVRTGDLLRAKQALSQLS